MAALQIRRRRGDAFAALLSASKATPKSPSPPLWGVMLLGGLVKKFWNSYGDPVCCKWETRKGEEIDWAAVAVIALVIGGAEVAVER